MADNDAVRAALDLANDRGRQGAGGLGLKDFLELERQKQEAPKASIKSLSADFNKSISNHLSLSGSERDANSKRADAAVGRYVGVGKKGYSFPLLGKNAKLMKAEAGYMGGVPIKMPDGRGVETTGLALSPAYQHGSFNTCPNHSSCKKECLGKTSGMYAALGGGQDLTAFKGPRLNSLLKTKAMIHDPESFAVMLHDEIGAARASAKRRGNTLGVRLNVLSDINPEVHRSIIESYPDVMFYDYTKNNTNPIAANHHYTYSSTGTSGDDVHNPHQNWKQMRKRLDTGSNVAMAFENKTHIPDFVHDEETGKHYRVADGDTHDLRPLDKQPLGEDGVIVGLRNKNRLKSASVARKESNGFFVKYDPAEKRTQRGTLERGPSPGEDKSGNPILGKTMPTNKVAMIQTQTKSPDILNNDGKVVGKREGGAVVSGDMHPDYFYQQFHGVEHHHDSMNNDNPKIWEIKQTSPSSFFRNGGSAHSVASHALSMTLPKNLAAARVQAAKTPGRR